MHDFVRRGHRARRFERPAPRQQLEQDDPHGEQIASPVDDAFPRGLLRRQVIRRSEDDPGMRLRRAARIEHFRDPEIDELDAHFVFLPFLPPLNLRQEHVLRLQIAMHDPLPMRRVQRVEHRHHPRQRGVRLEPPRTREDGAEARAFEALHHHVRTLFAEARVEDIDDVRMADAIDGLRLLEETPREILILGELLPEELERDLTPGELVLGAEDLAHTAAAEALDKLVFPGDDSAGARSGGHGRPVG